VTITCTAKGGLHGGVLTLTRSGFDKLLFVSGEEIPEESVTLAPNETRVWEGVYAPLTHSEVKDDVSVAASFNEYVSGEFLLEEEKLTVLCVSFTPQVQIGAFLNRHKWGVGERVLCEWKPSGVDLRIIINYGHVDHSDFYVGETFRYYVCPFVEVSDVLFLECNGLSYKPETEVLFPKYLEATNTVERFYNLESGIPGGAGFNTEVYVCPKYVSFRELSFMEAPSLNSIITGYFNQACFSNVWYHTIERGAGEWYRIASDNFIFIDEVTMGDSLPLPVNKGSIIWIIPIAWTGGSVTNILPIRYEQSFTMSEFGCLRVSKFGYWVERNIYNERNVSEGVKRCIEVK
jgi:hypothetical protein